MRLEITYVLAEDVSDVPAAWRDETPSSATPVSVQEPSIVFRVLNRSKFAVPISTTYLDLGGEVIQREEGALPPDRQIPSGGVFVGTVRMDVLIGRLKDLGHSGTPKIQLVTEDSFGKRYMKLVKIPGMTR